MPENRVKLTVICLQISAVLCLVAVVLFQTLPVGIYPTFHSLVTGGFLAFALLSVYLAFGLQRRKRWAWNVSVGLFALYVASGNLLLGGVGLWGCWTSGPGGSSE